MHFMLTTNPLSDLSLGAFCLFSITSARKVPDSSQERQKSPNPNGLVLAGTGVILDTVKGSRTDLIKDVHVFAHKRRASFYITVW